MNIPKYRFIDLFAGIGGIRLAFERAGNQCVFSSEWDKYAQQTYSENFGEMPCGDITKIPAHEIPTHDILDSDFPVKTLISTCHKIQRLTGTFVEDGKTGLRLLSENECKAIMGFPKDFKIPILRTQMYRQFGNSVAVPVVEKIAKNITNTLESAT